VETRALLPATERKYMKKRNRDNEAKGEEKDPLFSREKQQQPRRSWGCRSERLTRNTQIATQPIYV